MKNRIHLLITVFLITVSSIPAYCQDLHIYYNLFNDSITYMKGGKQVDKLKLRKGQVVQVHLTEFNPFISNIDFKVEEITDDAGSGMLAGGGMSSFLGAVPGLSGLFPGAEGLLGGGGGLPLFDAPLMVVNDSTISFRNIKKLFGGARGTEQVELSSQTMKEIDIIMKDAQVIYSQLEAFEKAAQVSRMALVNVEPLRTNSNIKPSLIKSMCKDYYDAIFQNSQQGGLNLNDLLAWQSMPAQYELNLQRLKSKQFELSAKVSLLEGFSRDLTSNPIDDEEYRKFTRNMIDVQIKAKGVGGLSIDHIDIQPGFAVGVADRGDRDQSSGSRAGDCNPAAGSHRDVSRLRDDDHVAGSGTCVSKAQRVGVEGILKNRGVGDITHEADG